MTNYNKIPANSASAFSFSKQGHRTCSCTLKKAIKSLPYKATIFLTLMFFVVMASLKAQQTISYALHANIIYRFTRYVEWPEYDKAGDFVIGIIGDSPLYNELEHFVENKTVNGKKIAVRKVTSPADYYNCQILFISDDN